MNIVKMLDITYKEDIISNLLVGAINQSKIFRESFLKNLIGIQNIDLYDVKAYVRIGTSMGIPDIVISLKRDSDNKLIIIENKLRAEEGYEQTKRYSDEKCIEEICKKVELVYKDIEGIFIYLTLIPEQISSGEKFKNITYKNLIDKVKCEDENELLSKFLSDFFEVMKNFYESLDVNKNDKVLELLNENIEKEKIFIRFKKIIDICIKELNNEFKLHYLGKVGGRGRENFIAKISKGHWRGEEAKFKKGFYNVSEETFDIHFELSFDILNKKLGLPLHYEINPYMGEKKIINLSKENDYNKYLDRRNKVKSKIHKAIQEMHSLNIKGFNGSNQIAKIEFKIDDDTTVEQFISMLGD